MPDYQKMYHSLFNDVSDAISKLQEAQQKTEEIYIDSKEPVLTTLKGGADEKKADEAQDNKTSPPKKNAPSHDER